MAEAEIQEESRRFSKDNAYYDAHFKEFLDEYPDQWVAVYHEEVVGTSHDARELLTRLKKEGVPLNKVLVKHPTGESGVFILVS